MSTQNNPPKLARRTTESLLAEVIICKKLGWPLGFISGGQGAYTIVEFKDLLEKISALYGDKLWINIGALSEEEIKKFLPYTKGIVASIETINTKLHAKVCPSKPIKPFEKMLDIATKYNLKKAITIILGLGETKEDFELLKNFINKHSITKIHFYGLNPQKGTIYENVKPPTKSYQAWWISQTRKHFPKMDIQAGIWLDRVNYISTLLKAGANSLSKYPAIRYFGSDYSKEIEHQAKLAGRQFIGTLTKLPKIDINKEVDNLNLDKDLKDKIKIKLKSYLRQLSKNV